jgi:glyoxylase-like metal-dependent hydrolase (beta-lactamase superfamily II)
VVRLVQLDLSGGWSIGESTLVIGPDGTSALIDVGNDAHADDVLAALDRELGARTVDVLVLTHYHADHVGGLDGLVRGGLEAGVVVTRGPVHLGRGANTDELAEVEDAPPWRRRVDLCTEGDCALPWRTPLGPGAELALFAADGRCWDGARVVTAPVALPDNDDGENARSLGGVVRFGSFVYLFAGDLTGGGKGTPDVESFVADAVPEDLVPATGASVVHLDHHGIDSSTNARWVAWAMPGGRRDAVAGTNHVYLDAPGNEVMGRLGPALGGGHVWVGEPGSLADAADPALRLTGGEVSITARADGTTRIE